MKIDIIGRDRFQVSEMLRGYTLGKLAKLERYALKVETAHVIYRSEKINQTCEIILQGKNLRLTAKETTTAAQASLDKAVMKLQHQLQRYHDKIKHHSREKIQDIPLDEREAHEDQDRD